MAGYPKTDIKPVIGFRDKAENNNNLFPTCQSRLQIFANLAPKSRMSPLSLMNESALNSLNEGFEETLTLHRLGLMPQLKLSFRTTNCIESLNSMVGQLTRNVKRWKYSNQRYRWLGAALLDIEPRLRRIKGFRFLPLLRRALQKDLKLQPEAQYDLAAD